MSAMDIFIAGLIYMMFLGVVVIIMTIIKARYWRTHPEEYEKVHEELLAKRYKKKCNKYPKSNTGLYPFYSKTR